MESEGKKALQGCLIFVVMFGVLIAFVAHLGRSSAPPPSSAPSQVAESLPTTPDQDGVVAKTKDAQTQAIAGGGYTRSEYADTYRELGRTAFSKLNVLEPGALYVAAESKQCDRVLTAGLSDRASAKNLRWYVDCNNGNRFMVDQEQAEKALARFKSRKLQSVDLAASCTANSLSMCDATPDQKAADESVVVASCDTLLDKALVSADGASKAWSWDYSFGKNNTLIVERDFSSENAFGAKIKSRYHCEADAATHRITKLIVSGPLGNQRIL